MQTTNLARRLVILAALVFIGLPICLAIYFSTNKYKEDGEVSGIDNANVVLDWMPSDVYEFTLDRLDTYFEKNNKEVTSMHVNDEGIFLQDDGTFEFTVDTQPTGEDFTIDVKTSNYSGTFSTSVYVNGELQKFSAVSKTSRTTYNGFEDLLSTGLSSAQVSAVQTELAKFRSARTITIYTDSFKQQRMDSDGNFGLSFGIEIDGRVYGARILYQGVSDIHLFLYDKNFSKVEYDSGVVTQTIAP